MKVDGANNLTIERSYLNNIQSKFEGFWDKLCSKQLTLEGVFMLETPKCSTVWRGRSWIAAPSSSGRGTPYSALIRRLICGNSHILTIGVVLAAMLMSGCAKVGPNFQKPGAAVSESWLDGENQAVKTDSVDYREWWKNFNDPTLDTLIEKAYEQNLPLQIAGLHVYEARAILGVAAGSLYPQVQSAQGSLETVRLSENAEPVSNLPPAVGSLVDTSFNNYRLGLDAAWELDFWGRFRRGLESADANFAATIASYDNILVTLTGEVAIAYILLRTLEERLIYTNSNVAIQKRSLEIAGVRFRNGLVTELDVQLARSLLGLTASVVPDLQAAIRKTKLALCLLLGMPPSELSDILGDSGKIPVAPEIVAVGIPADLLRRRPDIRSSMLTAISQSARIGVAKADMYPSFRLLGSIGYAADSGGDIFDSDSFFGFGVVKFNWNILNYGRIKNNVRVEDARFQQLVANYQNTVLNAAREVEDGLVSFLKAKQKVVNLEEAVEASRRSVKLAETQYRDGIISYSLVLDAQRSLVLTEDQLTAARGKVARGLIATYKALGGGWQIREGKTFIKDELQKTMSERTDWGGLMNPAAVKPVPADQRGSWRSPDW